MAGRLVRRRQPVRPFFGPQASCSSSGRTRRRLGPSPASTVAYGRPCPKAPRAFVHGRPCGGVRPCANGAYSPSAMSKRACDPRRASLQDSPNVLSMFGGGRRRVRPPYSERRRRPLLSEGAGNGSRREPWTASEPLSVRRQLAAYGQLSAMSLAGSQNAEWTRRRFVRVAMQGNSEPKGYFRVSRCPASKTAAGAWGKPSAAPRRR